MTRHELIAKLSERYKPRWHVYRADDHGSRAFATCDFFFPDLDAELVEWLNAVEPVRQIHVCLSDYCDTLRVRVTVFCDLEDAPTEEVQ
jgi:hypothetical protein